MLKLITLLVRKPELTHEQFLEHWTTVHAELALQIPQIARYHRNAFPGGPVNGIDGIAEVWFRNAQDRDAFRASEAGQRWIADCGNFMDNPRCQHFAVEETQVVG